MAGVAEIFQLKLTVRISEQNIWRNVQMSRNLTFQQLHGIIQNCFGWTSIYDHKFEASLDNRPTTIMPLLGIDYGDDAAEEAAVQLWQVFTHEAERGQFLVHNIQFTDKQAKNARTISVTFVYHST